MNHSHQQSKTKAQTNRKSVNATIKHSAIVSNIIQPKLTIGAPNDKYEQEADRVADQVMRMPLSSNTQTIHRTEQKHQTNTGIASTIQRKCTGCEEEGMLQKKSSGQTPEVTPNISTNIASLDGKGQPMSQADRSFFEPRFGTDFSNVRIHTDNTAAHLAQSINARAFTMGNNVVFGSGQYSSNSQGKHLMAHELTHTIQQKGSTPKINRHALENDPKKAPAMSCQIATTSPNGLGLDVTFSVNSSKLNATDMAAVDNFVSNWHAAGGNGFVRVDGYASIDGGPKTNWPLSCNRAEILANELIMPSSGKKGIDSTYVTSLYAHGETNQFSSQLAPNRRAQVHITSEQQKKPKDKKKPKQKCAHPGVSRTLDLQPIFMRTNRADKSPTGVSWTRRFNEANKIWGKIGVTFKQLTPVTIDTTLKTTGSNDREILAVMRLRSGTGIEVFIVDNDVAGQGGAATLQTGCDGNEKTIMSDRGTSNTILAHELGHVMGLGHNGNNSDPGTVMDTTGSHSIDNPTKNTIANFNFIKCPKGSGTTCLKPDK